MIYCGRCGKKCETIVMTCTEHYDIYARFRQDGNNYGKRINLCDSCHAGLKNWLFAGGYDQRDIPALPIINSVKERNDLKLEINTLKKENEDLQKRLASREEHAP